MSTEELAIFDEETNDQTSSNIRPQDAGLDRSTRVEGKSLNAEAGERADNREKDQMGNSIEFGGPARDPGMSCRGCPFPFEAEMIGR